MSDLPSDPACAVARAAAIVLEDVLDRPATLGRGRLICVDGPSGAGKTTLAAALRRAARDRLRQAGGGAARRDHVSLLHMDNLYDGWEGLTAGMSTLAHAVLEPLSRGEAGHYRRYDWAAGRFAEPHRVGSVEVLLVEGVGAGAGADLATVLVWLDTPPAVCHERTLRRDGEAVSDQLRRWRIREAEMFAQEQTRARADLVVDGRTGEVLRAR